MRHIFLDTNILLDLLLARKNRIYAEQVFLRQDESDIRVCASALSIANIAYILRQSPADEKKQYLQTIRDMVKILPLDARCIDRSLTKNAPDFEDMLQYQCAIAGGCECIITGNIRHFKPFSRIPVLTAKEFLDSLGS